MNSNSIKETVENRGFVIVMAMLFSMVMGMMYAFSIFIIPLESTFGWARHQTAMTFSLMKVFFALGMLSSGNIMARLSPGKTASVGGLLAASGFFLASFSPNLYVLYLGYGIMGGYGIGMANMVPISVLIRWFPDKRGLAVGLATMSMSFGTLVLGTTLSGALVGIYGWSVTFRVIAGVFLLVAGGGGLLLKFPPLGYAPKNWIAPAGQDEIWGYSRANVLKTGACWLLCLWMMCMQAGGLMIFSHVVPLAVEQGVSLSNAVLVMGVYSICMGGGRLFFGWIHDNIGLKSAMATGSIFLGAGLIGLIFLYGIFGLPGLLVTICLVAMGHGSAVPLLALACNSFFGPKYFPENFGFFALPGALVGGLLGPLIGGYIHSMTGSYIIAVLIAATLAALGILVVYILKPLPRRTDEA